MTEETEVAKKAPEENRTVVRTQEVKKTFVMSPGVISVRSWASCPLGACAWPGWKN